MRNFPAGYASAETENAGACMKIQAAGIEQDRK
jgi:hypothetical protein